MCKQHFSKLFIYCFPLLQKLQLHIFQRKALHCRNILFFCHHRHQGWHDIRNFDILFFRKAQTISGRSCHRIRHSSRRYDHVICRHRTAVFQYNTAHLFVPYIQSFYSAVEMYADFFLFQLIFQRPDHIGGMIGYRKYPHASFCFQFKTQFFKILYNSYIIKS